MMPSVSEVGRRPWRSFAFVTVMSAIALQVVAQVHRCTDERAQVEYRAQACGQERASDRARMGDSPARPLGAQPLADPARPSQAATSRSRPPLLADSSGTHDTLLRLAKGAEIQLVAGDRPGAREVGVVLHRPGRDVLLVLASSYRVSWQLEVSAETRLRAVVVMNAEGGESPVAFQTDRSPSANQAAPLRAPLYRTALTGMGRQGFANDATWRKQLAQLLGSDELQASHQFEEIPYEVHAYRTDKSPSLWQRARTLLQPEAVSLALSKQPPPEQLGKGAELMIVHGYESPSGSSTVFIDRPGKEVLLTLFSYEPVRWRLRAEAGTKIRAVLVASGTGKSELAGPASTPAYAIDTGQGRTVRHQIARLERMVGATRLTAARADGPILDELHFYREERLNSYRTWSGPAYYGESSPASVRPR